MAMRLFFILVTVGGSAYLLFTDRGDRRFTIGVLAGSAFLLLLQLNVITLHIRHARTLVWAAIAVCATLLWLRDNSKNSATVAASMVFVAALTVARELRMLH